MTTRALGLGLAVAVLVTMPAMGVAKPRGPAKDRVWVHPEIERLRPTRIAILPAVSFVNIPKERAYLEDIWLQGMRASRHVWMPAVLCRERMAATSRGGDSLLNAIGNQVRSRGRVDSTSSPRLTRLLQSQALLCLRVDRWERVGGSGNSDMTYVDMTATLVDSTGRLLWRVSSVERLESVYGVPKLSDMEPAEASGSAQNYRIWRELQAEREQRKMSGRPGEMGMTTQSALAVAADFRAGVSNVLARWAARFPESPRRSAATVAR